MRGIIILGCCLVAALAAPLFEESDDPFEALAQLDDEGHLEPFEMSDDQRVAKRTIDDKVLEDLLLAKMEIVFKILGPLAPQPVKDAIRKIVNERKTEIIQALKVGGAALIRILMDIWRKAFFGGLLG